MGYEVMVGAIGAWVGIERVCRSCPPTRVLVIIGLLIDLFCHGHHLFLQLQHIVLAFLHLGFQVHHELVHCVFVCHDIVAEFLTGAILTL